MLTAGSQRVWRKGGTQQGLKVRSQEAAEQMWGQEQPWACLEALHFAGAMEGRLGPQVAHPPPEAQTGTWCSWHIWEVVQEAVVGVGAGK